MCSRLVLVSLLLCVSGCLWTQAQTGSEGASTSETQGQSAQGNSSSSGKQQEDKGLGGSTEGKIKIDTVNPDSAASGEAIEIKGSSFGKQGKVWVKDQEATVSSWKSDQILAVVPDGIPAGEATVMVQPDRQDKTTYQGTFKVKPSPYDKTAFQILTGVGASFLPIETTSYKSIRPPTHSHKRM